MRALHPGDMHFQGRDHADRIWVLGFTADDGPVAYHAFDRSTGKGTFLFHHKPDLSGYTLAAMEPFAFTSRDGLDVHGYLSFPPGADRTRLPTVLFVHGGPWARDEWGFVARRRSGSPTAATCASRSTTAARPGTASGS